ALALAAGLGLAQTDGKLTPPAFAGLLALLIGGDLWRSGRHFWQWSRPEQEWYAEDPIVHTATATPPPYRLLDLPGRAGVYPGAVLMRHGVPQVLGYHGFELQNYLDLVDKNDGYKNLLSSTHLWRLLSVRYFVLADTIPVPGYHQILGPVTTAVGQRSYLYQADTVPP